ncbi:THAP domain-containing protein 2-like [Strongylocentrotus purpuratus]|uniref:THAP-type domain-containing protein n=1 Tax=Strongylocentrotus purpuratus TaxID=7668 RepID=A0A7M7NGT7_STRPU|nr:THAP domain-containing protein 2-like [Strongylocentrotus purpuratus]
MPFCAAFNCTNRLKKGSGITFHRFPKSGSALLKEWLVKMRRDKWIPNKYSTMCSIHFEEVCFDRTGQTTRLREGSIPTIFNFSAHLKEKQKQKNQAESAIENSLQMWTVGQMHRVIGKAATKNF